MISSLSTIARIYLLLEWLSRGVPSGRPSVSRRRRSARTHGRFRTSPLGGNLNLRAAGGRPKCWADRPAGHVGARAAIGG